MHRLAVTVPAVHGLTTTCGPKPSPVRKVGSAAESKQAAQELGKYLIDNAWFVVFNYANSIFATDKKTTAKDTVGSGYPYFPTYAPKA